MSYTASFNWFLTSLPAGRETHRAEKIEGYFNFKQLKICAHVDIHYDLI